MQCVVMCTVLYCAVCSVGSMCTKSVQLCKVGTTPRDLNDRQLQQLVDRDGPISRYQMCDVAIIPIMWRCSDYVDYVAIIPELCQRRSSHDLIGNFILIKSCSTKVYYSLNVPDTFVI